MTSTVPGAQRPAFCETREQSRGGAGHRWASATLQYRERSDRLQNSCNGDPRRSVDRSHNVYGTPKLAPERTRIQYECKLMTRPPVRLNAEQRVAAEMGVKEACENRGVCGLLTLAQTMFMRS
jgi:hypothetical protein